MRHPGDGTDREGVAAEAAGPAGTASGPGELAARAYALYQRRGELGDDEIDGWYEEERLLREKLEQEKEKKERAQMETARSLAEESRKGYPMETKPWQSKDGSGISGDYLKSLMEEHNFILQIVDRLRVAIRTSSALLPENQRRRLLEEMLGTLVEKLTGHFAFEEKDGFLTDVVERRPDWSSRVDKLRSDHLQMLKEFRGLKDRCHSMELTGLQNAISSALDHYLHHETRETDLIQRIYYENDAAAD